MKETGLVVDADFCIKVGASSKYPYLERLLPELAEEVFVHRVVYDEIMLPRSAKEQVNALIQQGKLSVIDENQLDLPERNVYRSAYRMLAKAMIHPAKPKKNQGEVCSLALAKAKRIPYFATDEKNLQPIVNRLLNTGMDDITCIRIEDVIRKIKNKEIQTFTRKEAKVMWRLAGKKLTLFDEQLWPLVV